MRRGRASAVLTYLALAVLTVVALYFGKPIIMPVALAILFSFLLSPMVDGLVRLGLRQTFAVLTVVLFVFSVMGVMIWGFGKQMTSLVYELPSYKQNIREKIDDLRNAGSGSALERMRQSWREIKGELKKSSASPTNPPLAVDEIGATTNALGTTTNAPAEEAEPVPVVVRTPTATTVWQIPTALGPLLEVLATAALVVVLVIFMLLRKRELRNRLVVLFGYNRMPTTTRALDEAAERISKYLLMQTIINGSYGLGVGVAFYFLGLPYALMWGFLAALLRFIPYIGPWLGAAMPILLSLAVFPGWLHPFVVLGLILVFELISNMIMEPMLYGQTVGVSEVALITAVAFWTWLWGPIGLALATPLTVCLVVLGKYVPGMGFVPLLMGDEPVMQAPQLFYQRLIAMDDKEATEIVEQYSKDHELVQVYDDLILPALMHARRDALGEKIATEHLDHIVATTGHLITKLANTYRGGSVPDYADDAQEVFGVPVEDTIDELAMSMLGNVLPRSVVLRSISAEALAGEVIDHFQARRPAVACIGAVTPGGVHESRYLLKRLQTLESSAPIVIARWGLNGEKKIRELAKTPGVTAVATTLVEARNHLTELAKISEATAVAGPVSEPVSVPQLEVRAEFQRN
ncbi:MAG TPA: AI-2E family transporter [Verrucomicrobiae bacterium]